MKCVRTARCFDGSIVKFRRDQSREQPPAVASLRDGGRRVVLLAEGHDGLRWVQLLFGHRHLRDLLRVFIAGKTKGAARPGRTTPWCHPTSSPRRSLSAVTSRPITGASDPTRGRLPVPVDRGALPAGDAPSLSVPGSVFFPVAAGMRT